jgi:hypothetical protein
MGSNVADIAVNKEALSAQIGNRFSGRITEPSFILVGARAASCCLALPNSAWRLLTAFSVKA